MAYEDVECPYCEHPQNIDHDDGYGYEEGVKHQQQCEKCGKHFTYTTEISFYYEVEKSDCLNDGEHEWKPTHTYPKEFTRMECASCGEKRSLTDEEWIEFNNHNQ